MIEHNLDVIKCADYIIDLGPEGGSGGGTIIATGTPEQIAQTSGSFTGEFLRPILERAGTLTGTESPAPAKRARTKAAKDFKASTAKAAPAKTSATKAASAQATEPKDTPAPKRTRTKKTKTS